MIAFSLPKRARAHQVFTVACTCLATWLLMLPVSRIHAEDPASRWPLYRKGMSQRLGNSTYFNSPTVTMSAQRIGSNNYYTGYDRARDSSFTGDSYQLGKTTYYNLNRSGQGSFSGSSYKLGNTTYYEGTDRTSGERISGSSYRLGNTEYYDFQESGTRESFNWSSQSLGNSTYYGD